MTLLIFALLLIAGAFIQQGEASCCGCCCPCCCCKPIIIKLPPPPCKVCPCCCGCGCCGCGGGGRKRRSIDSNDSESKLSDALLPKNDMPNACGGGAPSAVHAICSQIPPNERGPICNQLAQQQSGPFAPRTSDFGRQGCSGCTGCTGCGGACGAVRKLKKRELSFNAFVKDSPFALKATEKVQQDDVPEIEQFAKSQSALPSADQDRTHQVLFRNNLELVVKEENKSNI